MRMYDVATDTVIHSFGRNHSAAMFGDPSVCMSRRPTTTITWLLLLLLIVSSQSVDSQSTTDHQVCDGQHFSESKEDVGELKRGIHRILLLLDNQQQFLQTMMNRLGKS